MRGWIGVDLDGTLAYHTGTVETIGPPLEPMVRIIKNHLAKGHTVKVFTARMSGMDSKIQAKLIADWTLEVFGQELEATCQKDYRMIMFYDDRAKEVVHNVGRLGNN